MKKLSGSELFLIALLALFVTAAAITGLAQLTALLTCGPVAPEHPLAGVVLLFTGDASSFTAENGCSVPLVPFRIVAIIATIVIAALLIIGLTWLHRYRQSDKFFIKELQQRKGFATGSEIDSFLSRKAVLKRAKQLRPTLTKPQPSDVGWRVGRSRNRDIYVSIEDSVLVEGAPRTGKGFRVLISAILDWSGPLITTSTTNDNLTATIRQRAKRGTVHVFDPQGLSGVRNPLRISPIAGCEDPMVAMQRASAIINGTALGSSGTNQEWAQASSVVLSRLLHAAAVGHRTVADLYDWGSAPGMARAAVGILRADGTPGWGDSLESILDGDEKLLSSTWFGVQGAVAPLAAPQIRDSLEPRPGDPIFDPLAFLSGENTLYLIGSASGAAAMGGFLSAILDDLVEVARRKALASPNSRLDLPLGLILDEIANMFRWESLPRTMADGGGRGICTLVVLQALSQAETAWSRAAADTIWAAATAKILLGGASQTPHLRDIEQLMGNRESRRHQTSYTTGSNNRNISEQVERLPLITVDEIRRMPSSLGLLAYRNRRGVLLDLTGWDERSDAREIIAGKKDVEREQQGVFSDMYTAQATVRPGPALPPVPEMPAEFRSAGE